MQYFKLAAVNTITSTPASSRECIVFTDGSITFSVALSFALRCRRTCGCRNRNLHLPRARTKLRMMLRKTCAPTARHHSQPAQDSMINTVSDRSFSTSHPGKAHERQRQQAGHDQRKRRALHQRRHIGQLQALAHAAISTSASVKPAAADARRSATARSHTRARSGTTPRQAPRSWW